MKFLYKIHSGFDGFTPRRIPERLVDGRVELGWTKYLDVVEVGTEVWVYFYGQHRFEPGVYIKGFVESVDHPRERVFLKMREYSSDGPLTDAATSARVAAVVRARRFRQVFLYPEEWDPIPACDMDSTCSERACGNCPRWSQIPRIQASHVGWPRHLLIERRPVVSEYVPGYWVIPARCYLHQEGRPVSKGVKQSNELFYRFKSGEQSLAFPLALGVYESLRQRTALHFDAVVPIPLSPEKEARGEIHRARLLAVELSRLLGAPVIESLSLTKPISKKALRTGAGFTADQFRTAYYEALAIDGRLAGVSRVLLVDDVCTEGNTLRVARRRIREVNKDCDIVAATAGQMIVKAVVEDETDLVDE